jgi:SecD/SecF fusion protein
MIGLGIALIARMLYLAVRFQWTFGAAAVLAMAHDVAILLGVFAWLGKPIDGVFLAALLTVIGYSVNDSVVVFDRIRELLRLRRREPLATVANDACLQTIPRVRQDQKLRCDAGRAVPRQAAQARNWPGGLPRSSDHATSSG